MKTSLGIWAFGGMATRFNPGGYKPELAGISTAEKVHTAVEGLGDLIDDYEFHYPQELSPENLDAVRGALDGHGIYCIASGLHLDPRFGKGGFCSPDDATRDAALRLTREAIDLAADVGAQMIIWPGIEGYNYPFQTPYAESWSRFIDGVGEAAAHAAEQRRHGVPRAQELRAGDEDPHAQRRHDAARDPHAARPWDHNVKVNMDWQHLIMNGENLAEYAALLAAEGLLGHQHANSGWGTFDDDNMVGATAFMETLELAVELRRAGYGENGERLGFDLYPYTEDAVGAVKRSVLQWRFIDGVAAKIDERRAAAGAAGEGRRPRLRARLRRARCVACRSSASTSAPRGSRASRSTRRASVLATASADYPLSRPQPDWAEQDPEDWWRAAEDVLARLPEGPIGLSGQMHGLVVLDADAAVLRPAILWNDQRTAAECAEIEERVGFDRLVELTGNRALTGFTAPKLLWLRRHEPELYGRIRHVLLPKDYVRLRLTGELATDVADASGTLLFDVRRRAWSEEVCAALEIPLEWLPPAHESTEIAGAGDQAAAALGVGISHPGPVSVVLGTSGVVFAALPSYAHDPEARLHAFCHAVPDTWHAMGVMLSAAGSAAWLRGVLGRRSQRARAGGGTLGGRQRGAALRAVSRRRANASSGSARARRVHGPLGAPRPRRALALDAGGRRLRAARLARAAARARRRPESGRVSGGGARSELWLRILASVLGLPLETTESEEGSAFGAALLAGIRAGVFADADDAVARCVRIRRRIEPEWNYDDGYRRFRRLYPTLRPLEEQ